jgi:hypothetical protein
MKAAALQQVDCVKRDRNIGDVDEEAERLWAKSQTFLGRILLSLKRLLLRILLIACGLASGAIAYFLVIKTAGIASRPIKTLSLFDLVAVAVYGIGGIYSGILALVIPFLSYPRAQSASDFIPKARRQIAERDAAADRDQSEAAKAAHRYAKSRLWGLMTDPTLSRRRPWMITLIVIVGYMLAVLIAFISFRTSWP